MAGWDSGSLRRGTRGCTQTTGGSHFSASLKCLCQGAAQESVLVEPRIHKEQCCFHHGCGTLDQPFILLRIFEDVWKFAQPVYMSFLDLNEAFGHVLQSILWEELQEYGLFAPLLRAIRSLYSHCKSKLSLVDVRLHRGCFLSQFCS